MEVLLVMVRHEVHVQMLIKYVWLMAIVQVRVINMMNSKMLYVVYCLVDVKNMKCISIISYRMQHW